MYKNPEALIDTLERHLKDMDFWSTDDDIRLVGATKILFSLRDESQLMLALIEGSKEK